MKLFRVGGTDIRINPFFIVMLIISALGGFLNEATIAVLVVTLHEASHGLMAKAMNVEVESIELLPFGAVARLTSAPMKVGEEILSAMAGPMANILSVMVAISLEKVAPRFFEVEELFVSYSMVLAIFNLIPALPLDGGRILRAALTPLMGRVGATRFACIMGGALCVILLALGVYSAVVDRVFNLTFFVIGVFVGVSAIKESRSRAYTMTSDMIHKSDRLSKDKILPIRNVAVYYNTPVSKMLKMRIPGIVTVFSVVDDSLRVLGRVSEGELLHSQGVAMDIIRG